MNVQNQPDLDKFRNARKGYYYMIKTLYNINSTFTLLFHRYWFFFFFCDNSQVLVKVHSEQEEMRLGEGGREGREDKKRKYGKQ